MMKTKRQSRSAVGAARSSARGDVGIGARTLVQKRYGSEPAANAPDTHALAAQGVAGSGGPLPHLDIIQGAFGLHNVSDVRAHVGGNAAEAATGMGAEGYATGADVAFRSSPSLHLAAHEAAHVVQQREGVHLSGGVGQENDPYERHADAVADGVVRGESVEALLGVPVNGNAPAKVQHKKLTQQECSDVLYAAAWIYAGNEPAALIAKAPAEHRSALRKLHKVVTDANSNDRDKVQPTELYERYQQASAALAPAFSAGRESMLSYYSGYVAPKDRQLRTRLAKRAADERARNLDLASGDAVAVADDASSAVRAAYLNIQTTNMRTVLKKLGTSAFRLDVASGAQTAEEVAANQKQSNDIGVASGGLMAVQGVITVAKALLDLNDEQFKERWAAAKADFCALDPSFKAVGTLAEFVNAWASILGGVAAAAASTVGLVAQAAGKLDIAQSMFAASRMSFKVLGHVGAVIQLVHGTMVLFDGTSTLAQKEKAVGNMVTSSAFLIGSGLGGAAMAGPAFVVALATWELIQFISVNFQKCKFAIANAALEPVFKGMHSSGEVMADEMKRIASAGILSVTETDPAQQAAFLDIVRQGTEGLRARCVAFLKTCRPMSTFTDKLKWRVEPGGYKAFQQAFNPHLGRKFGTKPEDVAQAVGEVVETISWCLTNADSMTFNEAAGRDMPTREGGHGVAADEQWINGDVVRAEWEGKHYPATIIETSDDGAKARLHWHGYGEKWHNLWVECLTLRPGSPQSGSAGAWKDGDSVTADFEGGRYPATILEVSDDGQRARLHWTGYGESWHEGWHSTAGFEARS